MFKLILVERKKLRAEIFLKIIDYQGKSETVKEVMWNESEYLAGFPSSIAGTI